MELLTSYVVHISNLHKGISIKGESGMGHHPVMKSNYLSARQSVTKIKIVWTITICGNTFILCQIEIV